MFVLSILKGKSFLAIAFHDSLKCASEIRWHIFIRERRDFIQSIVFSACNLFLYSEAIKYQLVIHLNLRFHLRLFDILD